MIKKIIAILVVCGVLVAGVYCYFKFFWNAAAQPSEITIDETVNIVDEIHQIADFCTASYYQEIAIQKKHKGRIFDDDLVIIAKGKVRAGFDLSQLADSNIIVTQDSIMLKLPSAKILDVITNPSDFETFEETGKWTHNEVTIYKIEAREILKRNAITEGLLNKATENGKEKLSNLFKAMGFKKVVIEIAET